MPTTKEWQLRTPLRELTVRVAPFAAQPAVTALDSSRVLMVELLAAVERGERQATAVLSEVASAIDGRVEARVHSHPLETHALAAQLRGRLLRATLRGQVVFERAETRKEGEVESLLSIAEDFVRSAANADPETTFIAVKVVDQDGDPVAGEPVQIELPDGRVHQGVTDGNGEILVDGLRPGGQAKISLPEVKQPGQAEPVELEHFVEIELRDEDGEPVPGVAYSLRDPAGVVHEGVLDSHGHAFVSPVAKGECTVRFFDERGPAGAASAFRSEPLPDTLELAPDDLLVRIVDQDGLAVAGREVVVLLPNGEEKTGTTGPDGAARIEKVEGEGNAEFRFADFDETDFEFEPAKPGAKSA